MNFWALFESPDRNVFWLAQRCFWFSSSGTDMTEAQSCLSKLQYLIVMLHFYLLGLPAQPKVAPCTICFLHHPRLLIYTCSPQAFHFPFTKFVSLSSGHCRVFALVVCSLTFTVPRQQKTLSLSLISEMAKHLLLILKIFNCVLKKNLYCKLHHGSVLSLSFPVNFSSQYSTVHFVRSVLPADLFVYLLSFQKKKKKFNKGEDATKLVT